MATARFPNLCHVCEGLLSDPEALNSSNPDLKSSEEKPWSGGELHFPLRRSHLAVSLKQDLRQWCHLCRVIVLGFLYGLKVLPPDITSSKLLSDVTTWLSSGEDLVDLKLKFLPKRGHEWFDIELIEFHSSLKPHLTLAKLEVVATSGQLSVGHL